MNEEILNEVLRKLNILLDEKDGLKLSGNGMIANNTRDIIEKLEKIDKKLFFLEKRQQDWFDNYVKK